MTKARPQAAEILRSLVALPHETEWVEFKHNDSEPEEIGEYLSALSNSAALHEEKTAYLVWGVENATHKVIGTEFRPRERKIGNEDLEPWLARHLHPRVHFCIHEFTVESEPVVLFSIEPCAHTPVRWKDYAYIRVGSYKKKLRDYPEKERALWARISLTSFEDGLAARSLSGEEVLARLDYPTYFEMLEQPVPATRAAILNRLEKEGMVQQVSGDRWDVANFGAILFARKLPDFDTLVRKAIRVIVYRGPGRTEALKEQEGGRGYAAGFQGLISYIADQLPGSEQIGEALRHEVRVYPEIAIRELVANAIIHQDFSIRGTGPTVEIFTNRIEITNPGKPLIDTLRFIDEPPRSRNEALAAFMRRANICEERGSGIDKVVHAAEFYQLPAPEFRVTEQHTVAILYAPRQLRQMDRQDRIRACYQHAALQYVSGQVMTNATLRKRLGIEEKNYAIASRVIADTIEEGLVRPRDPANTSKKHASYVPFWV
ncbi:MAG: putative DNA binding domain-containing protein [Bryobacterales bacterium]|nr:putative DNA binding domain-containing protein [Bryobacterales bacterium]